ncbi:GtrA family protein [Fluviicola taffensis]|uniref:GtrA family protein n=1 Tax=Fluviicola taffensis TaxID=191579 RepID=UPI003137C0CE
MKMFLKAQLSSLIATAVDFGFTVLLIEGFLVKYVIATSIGAVLGGVVNFTVNKYWSFAKGREYTKTQVLKYGMVWIGSILLNTVVSAFILSVMDGSYLIVKILVSLIVGISFNYSLQKYYVFS